MHRAHTFRVSAAGSRVVTATAIMVDVNLTERLVPRRRSRLARELLPLLYRVEFPAEVTVGEELQMVHRGMGTVIHPSTRIGNRVRIYHQVTIWRGEGHPPAAQSQRERIEIGDDVVLFPGAKILGGPGVTHVGTGTIHRGGQRCTHTVHRRVGDMGRHSGAEDRRSRTRLVSRGRRPI